MSEDVLDDLSVYELVSPVEWGDEEISRIEMKPNGKMMKGFVQDFRVSADGLSFDPYKYAELGLRLAGKARAIVDSMTPADQYGLGAQVVGFTTAGQGTGERPSL